MKRTNHLAFAIALTFLAGLSYSAQAQNRLNAFKGIEVSPGIEDRDKSVVDGTSSLGNVAQGDPTRARNIVYVTSFDSDAVLRFNADTGAFLGVFVPPGSGGLNGPTGLTFGPDGHLYVATFVYQNRVLKYDGRSGLFLGVFVEDGSGGLQGPMDLEFGPNGDLYVVSSYAGGIFRYNGQTGAFVGKVTAEPSGAEALAWRQGHLYVSSHMSDNVIRFDGQTGSNLGAITDGFLDWATGFDFGPDGNVYVASFFDNSVVKFNFQTGEWMGTFASSCLGPQMIEFGPGGDLFVASYHGDSVDRFDGRTGVWKMSMWGNGLEGAMDIAFRPR